MASNDLWKGVGPVPPWPGPDDDLLQPGDDADAGNFKEVPVRISANQPDTALRMTRCSVHDMTFARCAKLTITACQVALMAHEASRTGRPGRFLRDLVDEQILDKLRVMSRLSPAGRPAGRTPMAMSARTFVLSPYALETNVTLGVGDMLHWYGLRMVAGRSAWRCVALDAGCPRVRPRPVDMPMPRWRPDPDVYPD